jgi:hypothetical protein
MCTAAPAAAIAGEREVTERFTHRQGLFDPALGLLRSAEGHQRPHPRPHREHRTEAVAELTEGVQRLA